MKIDRGEILKFMSSGAERPLSLRELMGELKIPKYERNTLMRLLRKLSDEGLIIRTRDGRFGLTKKMNLMAGTLSCHPDGFGFVVPEEGGEDIFINPRKLRDAMHGDKVVARIEGYKTGGRREGIIIRVLERAHKKIIGTFKKTKTGAFVIPSDEKILNSITIASDKGMDANNGEMVEAEIIRFPGAGFPSAVGKVLSVLGNPRDPEVEIEVIARKYGLPHRFPPDVLHEVKDMPTEVREEDLEGRADLRNMRVFTVDGETAKDFDDSVGIERTKKGYRLLVSIADVSHYVKEGTFLDKEAFSRGTSVYFPGRCIPMLPIALSNGICSLNPRVERLTLTAELEFDQNGNTIKTKFYESVIKSLERLTYTKVKEILSGGDRTLEERYSRILGDLRTMEELALKLRENRAEEGSIDFDLPEPEIILDIEGRPQDIVRAERNIAHRIIEEFMLAANRVVAEFFTKKNYPFVYRVHSTPDEGDIAEFREFISSFGHRMEKGVTPKTFQKLLKSVEGRPEEKLINHVLLRSMKQASYSSANIGHFGLAFKDYTHFTSPIRRYPDLTVHRLLKKFLHRHPTHHEREHMEAALPQTALHSSQRERKAMEAEREGVDLKKAQFMQDKVGEVFAGLISGVTSFGFFVELKDWFVEGLVHVTTLKDDYYSLMEKEHALVGENTKRRFRIGGEVSVAIKNVDIERRRIDLELSENFPGAKAKKGRRK